MCSYDCGRTSNLKVACLLVCVDCFSIMRRVICFVVAVNEILGYWTKWMYFDGWIVIYTLFYVSLFVKYWKIHLSRRMATAVKGVYCSDDVLLWFEWVVSLQWSSNFSNTWSLLLLLLPVLHCERRLCSLDFCSLSQSLFTMASTLCFSLFINFVFFHFWWAVCFSGRKMCERVHHHHLSNEHSVTNCSFLLQNVSSSINGGYRVIFLHIEPLNQCSLSGKQQCYEGKMTLSPSHL